MNRLARVVKLNNHSVTLKLIKSAKCIGCPTQCNEPLVDLFSLKNNALILDTADLQYQLLDPENILTNDNFLNKTISLHFENNELLKSSVWYYFFPLILCLIGLTLGHYIGVWLNGSKDFSALLGLIIGLFLSYGILQSKIFSTALKYRPKVTISTF